MTRSAKMSTLRIAPVRASRRPPLFVLLLLIVCVVALRSLRLKGGAPPPITPCDTPGVLITVLTSTRHRSLRRLLNSLASSTYFCSTVDLTILVDYPRELNDQASYVKCTELAQDLNWMHGTKLVFSRISNAGLRLSWFEIPRSDNYEYTIILEDDMEVSEHYFTFLSWIHGTGALSEPHLTGICLHPGDWEVHVDVECNARAYSPLLYASPEPCNWGPVWKSSEWNKFVEWVTKMSALDELPYVPDAIAYDFNSRLHQNMDIQSSWVWRYNFETSKRQVRYSFTKCWQTHDEIFLAINHKEPGEHFDLKLDFQNNVSNWAVNITDVRRMMLSLNSWRPHPFLRYTLHENPLDLTNMEDPLE